MLVSEAIRLRFDSFIRALSYWSQQADPDGTEDDAASGRDARRLHLSQSYQNMWFGDLGALSRCSACSWATRPWPGASASWPTPAS
jgi:hypothetical protein